MALQKKGQEHEKYQASNSPFSLFLSLMFKRWGRGSRKGKWRWQADPPDQANKSAVQKEFCCLFFFFSVQRSSHWSCRSSQSCGPRTRRENVSSAISQTTTKKKKKFFLLLFMGTPSDPSTTPTKSQQCPSQLKKKRELLFPAHISHFTVPERLQKCSSFPFFFISLPKSFFNFCSRYLLRNRMCGQAKLPGPEVQLQKIYSRHPLDFS